MLGVGSAVVVAQCFNMLAALISSRLYSPDNFGQFGLFINLCNVLSAFALLGLNEAVLAPARERDAIALFAGGLVLIPLAALPLTVVAAVLIYHDWFGFGTLTAYGIPLAGFYVCGLGLAALLQVWLARRQLYRVLGFAHVVVGFGRFGLQVGLGLLGLGFFGLALAEVITRCTVAALMGISVRADVRSALQSPPQVVREVLGRYRSFPIYRTPSNLAGSLGLALPPVLITLAYSLYEAGLYTLTAAVIAAPLGLAQKAVGDVFAGHYAAAHRSDRSAARRLLARVSLALFLLGMVPALLLFFFGPQLFGLCFGETWTRAGLLAAILSPLFLADLVIGSISPVMVVANRPAPKLVFDAIKIAGLIGGFLFARSAGLTVEGFIAINCATGVIAYLVFGALIVYGTEHPRDLGAVRTVEPEREFRSCKEG